MYFQLSLQGKEAIRVRSWRWSTLQEGEQGRAVGWEDGERTVYPGRVLRSGGMALEGCARWGRAQLCVFP